MQKSRLYQSFRHNISYRNLGYAEGYADGVNNTGTIIYTYHEHVAECSKVCGGTLDYTKESQSDSDAYKYKIYCRKCNAKVSTQYSSEAKNEYLAAHPTCTIKSYICGKTTSSIESATIVFE